MIRGERIWDLSCVTDRDQSRFELTDLVRFNGVWYCGFREGEIHHNHPSGRGRVIRSADGKRWETAALFQWDGADVREPKLSITAEGCLMANTSLYFVSREPRSEGQAHGGETPPEVRNQRDRMGRYYQLDGPGSPTTDGEAEGVARQSVTWLSRDGSAWESATTCSTGINTWRWEAAWHNGMGYSVGYSGKDRTGTLYRTRDGRNWRPLAQNFFPDGKGTEATISFLRDDTACCVLRDGRTRATIGVGKAPYYREWRWMDARVDWEGDGTLRPADEVFHAPLGGPKLIRLSDGRLMVAARMLGPGQDDGRVTLFFVDPERGILTKWSQVDGTTYPGMVEHEGRLWISYGVRDASGIYLAKTDLPQ